MGLEKKRLRPYTLKMNKCLVPVNKKKRIIDYALENVLKLNYQDLNFFLHYKSEQVKNYIKKKYGYINYNFFYEKKPLGTIGGLSKLNLNKKIDIIILINADVICDVDYERIINFHLTNKADFTIVTSQKVIKLKYGLLKNLNLNIDSIEEKPSLSFNINTGIYIFNPDCLKFIKKNQTFDAVKFIKSLKKNKKKILSYPIYEKWFDLGTPEDLFNFKKLKNNDKIYYFVYHKKRTNIYQSLNSCLKIKKYHSNLKIIILDGNKNNFLNDRLKILSEKVDLEIVKQKKSGFMNACMEAITYLDTGYFTFMYDDDILSPYFGKLVSYACRYKKQIYGYGKIYPKSKLFKFKNPKLKFILKKKLILWRNTLNFKVKRFYLIVQLALYLVFKL